MLSIHNNLSAGAQNVTGAYVIIMLVYRSSYHYIKLIIHYIKLIISCASQAFV